LSGRIIEERRRRLLPETVEMPTCLKNWELGEKREQHGAADNKKLEHSTICTLMKKNVLLLVTELRSESETCDFG
jgi:hypothetical protein